MGDIIAFPRPKVPPQEASPPPAATFNIMWEEFRKLKNAHKELVLAIEELEELLS